MVPGVKYQYRAQGARVHQQGAQDRQQGAQNCQLWAKDAKPKLQFPHLQIYTLTTDCNVSLTCVCLYLSPVIVFTDTTTPTAAASQLRVNLFFSSCQSVSVESVAVDSVTSVNTSTTTLPVVSRLYALD